MAKKVLERLLDAGQKLDEANIPEAGRFAVLSVSDINSINEELGSLVLDVATVSASLDL